MSNRNYEPIISKARLTINSWTNRHITLLGKIEVVNSLIASLFTYKMQVLPLMNQSILFRINRMISNFIWNGRKPKIKLEQLMLDKPEGGRKLVNIEKRDISLKAVWVRRLHDRDVMLTALAYYYLKVPMCNELIWECNFEYKDIKMYIQADSFWKDVITSWSIYNFHTPTAKEQVLT